ncbi:MAG: hypothetical protein JOZ41_00295 [Chloroflexi bacterium]|nr:hypothetical protein [Chloroflexota bacterium]
MAKANALFIGWGPAVRGREQKALQVFGEAVEYWTRLQQEGEIEGFETYALDPHGGELAGFLIARGDPDKLARLRATEEFTRINTRAALVVDDLGVVGASTGEELQRLFSDFGTFAGELG